MKVTIDELVNKSFVNTLATGVGTYGVLVLEAELLVGKEGQTAVMFLVSDGRRLVTRTTSLVQAIEVYNEYSEVR